MQSRRPYVTSRDQLWLSATIRGPGGTTMVKVLSHNLMGSIRAYKYKHSTTSAGLTRPHLVLHDHKCIHTTKVDPHDRMRSSTRPYSKKSSLERARVPKPSQMQSTTNSNHFCKRRDTYSNRRITTAYLGNCSDISLISSNNSTG